MLDPETTSVRPTHVRYTVLGFLCALAGVLYLDRICIASAIDSIEKDLGLTHTQSSYVLMAFTLSYGLFELPTGRWGDVIGPRRVLTRISLWWSAFTALTGGCYHLGTLLVVRFLFGAGEAGAFPNAARVLSRWFPEHERGRAQGILLACSQFGGALAPFLAAYLIGLIGWRWTFVVFGAVGAVWAAAFYRWFRDEPAQHPAVSPEEVELIGRGSAKSMEHGPIPWGLVVRNPSIWFLGTIMAAASFNSYIYFSWFPKYLKEARAIDPQTAGLMASMVLAFAGVGTFAGGVILDRWVLGGGVRRRRIYGGLSFVLAAGALGLALLAEHPWLAAVLTACSCFCTQSTQSLWWSSAIGISGRHVGALFGLMNSLGVFGGMSSQYLTGALADHFGKQGLSGRAQWDPIFQIDLGVLLFAGLLWGLFVMREVEPAVTTESTMT